jgi:hypothetical protein
MGSDCMVYRSWDSDNEDHVTITSLELHKNEVGYYLSAKFKIEDERSIKELDIPKIGLPVAQKGFCIRTEYSSLDLRDLMYIDFGFGELRVLPTKDNGKEVLFTERVIEEKTKEMTLEEIEKKLGHKVKIVSKEK